MRVLCELCCEWDEASLLGSMSCLFIPSVVRTQHVGFPHCPALNTKPRVFRRQTVAISRCCLERQARRADISPVRVWEGKVWILVSGINPVLVVAAWAFRGSENVSPSSEIMACRLSSLSPKDLILSHLLVKSGWAWGEFYWPQQRQCRWMQGGHVDAQYARWSKSGVPATRTEIWRLGFCGKVNWVLGKPAYPPPYSGGKSKPNESRSRDLTAKLSHKWKLN